MAGPHAKTRMNPNTVIRIYKLMKSNPNKVWVRTEFSRNYRKVGWILNNSINLLIHLGLIEVVPAIYYCGTKMQTRRDIKGFRLKQDNKNAIQNKNLS